MKRFFFRLGVYATAWLARSPLHGLSRFVMRTSAAQSLRINDARPQSTVQAAAREWQRMFPLGPGEMPITREDRDTVYLEIRAYCPLQATDDLGACNRLMEYDRVLLGHIGARLAVLASQAQPGVKVCTVALRAPGASVADLNPVLPMADE